MINYIERVYLLIKESEKQIKKILIIDLKNINYDNRNI
jgi:hypothetical protein